MIEIDKIHHGDCFDVIKEIDDGSISMMVTDPPYLFDNGRWHSSKAMGTKSILGKGSIFDTDDMIYNEMSKFGVEDITRFLDLVLPKFKIPNMYICCSDTQVPIYGMWARDNNLHFSILCWEKPLSVINKNRFSTNAEYICRIYDFGTALNRITPNEIYNKVIHVPTEKSKLRPTAKPVALFQRLIMLSSEENGIVLDPFCGSGTAAVAAWRAKRHFICVEKEQKYFDIATKRIATERQNQSLF